MFCGYVTRHQALRALTILAMLALGLVAVSSCVARSGQADRGKARWAAGTGEARREAHASAAAPRTLWMAAVGDIMLDRKVGQRIKANGPGSILAKVRTQLRAPNITFGNLECPLSTSGPHDPPNCCFRADPESVAVLVDGGFTVVSLANNHTLDAGSEGVRQTLETLQRNKIAYVGVHEYKERSWQPVYVRVGRLRVGFMAFTDLSFQHGCYNKYDVDPVAARARVAQVRAKCDLLFVSVHWGDEYQQMPNERQQRTARELLDAGADCILGHHPHVLQGIGLHQGKPILYSMGNFVFDQRQGERMESALFELWWKEGGSWQIKATPVWIEPQRLGPIYPSSERSARIAARLESLSRRLGTPATVEHGRVLVRVAPAQVCAADQSAAGRGGQ